jgi:hypothetical protein
MIAYGNAFRKLAKMPSAIAGIGIAKVREKRAELCGSQTSPALGQAYILRQFKRPEEVEMMRRVYGRKFIQVSLFPIFPVTGNESGRYCGAPPAQKFSQK